MIQLNSFACSLLLFVVTQNVLVCRGSEMEYGDPDDGNKVNVSIWEGSECIEILDDGYQKVPIKIFPLNNGTMQNNQTVMIGSNASFQFELPEGRAWYGCYFFRPNE